MCFKIGCALCGDENIIVCVGLSCRAVEMRQKVRIEEKINTRENILTHFAHKIHNTNNVTSQISNRFLPIKVLT
jgi:hypothetical protein